jgi:hypothetical protein
MSALTLVSPGTLNAAFAMGATRTLWLSGIHTRTSVKADSKVLAGSDLRDALDPLGDQSYYFSAVRSVNALGSRSATVGLSPRRSRVWTGPSRTWQDFEETLDAVLTTLDGTEKAKRIDLAPIPVLASRATSGLDAHDAFDLSVVAPESLPEEVSDPVVLTLLQTWAYNGSFSITSTQGASLTAAVSLNGLQLGSVALDVDLSNPNSATCAVTTTPNHGCSSVMDEMASVLGNLRWIQVSYESGFTLSDGILFSHRYRDVRFSGWHWINLSGFDISKEKPTKNLAGNPVFDPTAIGTQDSLFCWVSQNWPDLTGGGLCKGWLASDDSSMEIADFIHFDDDPAAQRLTLLHVKGAHSGAGNRGISVSDYEVVASQAVKNLRSLDRTLATDGLEGGLNKVVSQCVWHDGVKQTDRTGMLLALRNAGDNYSRAVVILQPRVAKSQFDQARADLDAKIQTPRGARLRLLETLLVSTDLSCRAVGAELIVLGVGTPLTATSGGAKSGVRSPKRTTVGHKLPPRTPHVTRASNSSGKG